MGYMLDTEPCENCGYDAGDFAMGVGLMDDVPTYVVTCAACRAFRQVTSDEDTLTCPMCGGAVTVVSQLQAEPDSDVLCPRCETGTVRFVLIGLWD
jgi:hypothetical protein